MKTSEQIKGAIRNISKKTGVNPNSLLQMCLFEGVLEKLHIKRRASHFFTYWNRYAQHNGYGYYN